MMVTGSKAVADAVVHAVIAISISRIIMPANFRKPRSNRVRHFLPPSNSAKKPKPN